MLDALLQMLNGMLSVLGGLLPSSPFEQWAQVTEDMHLGLGWLNWVVDFNGCLGIFVAWLAVGVAVSIARFVLGSVFKISPWKAVTG